LPTHFDFGKTKAPSSFGKSKISASIRWKTVEDGYDAAGKELFRHEGFFGREDILAKWRDLGVELAAAPQSGRCGVEQLLAALSRAVGGAVWVALSAAFVWGVLSILLSPCHLTSIPLIVGLTSGE
jgi:hypothetical protein